ncbi:uncharacterized protein RCC_08739 [Ramularia collo-cygni]|uniref:Uncharacterized protein n=1 Tax=Ramularia collo-cygni TaxID=112498 RepID=A0A2D3VIH3_9PEZI|nr:uncharacterized protein RCC_08739 [Ramularia collo-cygni]CZT23029.1 uncharacterized protein RCC_08739 [Ramularia collo-cygni]
MLPDNRPGAAGMSPKNPTAPKRKREQESTIEEPEVEAIDPEVAYKAAGNPHWRQRQRRASTDLRLSHAPMADRDMIEDMRDVALEDNSTGFEATDDAGEDIEMEDNEDENNDVPQPRASRSFRLHPSLFDHSRTRNTTDNPSTLILYFKTSPTDIEGSKELKSRLDDLITKPSIRMVHLTSLQTTVYDNGGIEIRVAKFSSGDVIYNDGEGLTVRDVVEHLEANLKKPGVLRIETDIGASTFIEIFDAVEKK